MTVTLPADYIQIGDVCQSCRDLFSLSRADLLRWWTQVPRTLVGAAWHLVRHFGDMTLFDIIWLWLEALPSGFYDNSALGGHYSDRTLAPRLQNVLL